MKTRFITFLLLFVMNLGAFAQSPYQPAEENLKARHTLFIWLSVINSLGIDF